MFHFSTSSISVGVGDIQFEGVGQDAAPCLKRSTSLGSFHATHAVNAMYHAVQVMAVPSYDGHFIDSSPLAAVAIGSHAR